MGIFSRSYDVAPVAHFFHGIPLTLVNVPSCDLENETVTFRYTAKFHNVKILHEKFPVYLQITNIPVEWRPAFTIQLRFLSQFSLNILTELHLKKLFEPATSCVRGRDATTALARHRISELTPMHASVVYQIP